MGFLMRAFLAYSLISFQSDTREMRLPERFRKVLDAGLGQRGLIFSR
jgi:hypothetical protein